MLSGSFERTELLRDVERLLSPVGRWIVWVERTASGKSKNDEPIVSAADTEVVEELGERRRAGRSGRGRCLSESERGRVEVSTTAGRCTEDEEGGREKECLEVGCGRYG